MMDNIEQIFHTQEVMKQLEEDFKGKSVREIVELRFGAPIEKEKREHVERRIK